MTISAKARAALIWFSERQPVKWFDRTAPTDQMRRSLERRSLIERNSPTIGMISWSLTAAGRKEIE